MTTKIENTAVMNAIYTIALKLHEGVLHMINEQFKSEKEYQTRMSLLKEMLELGLIIEKEYSKIDTIFIEKYSPIFGTLYG